MSCAVLLRRRPNAQPTYHGIIPALISCQAFLGRFHFMSFPQQFWLVMCCLSFCKKVSFLKTQDKTGAHAITVASVNIVDATCAIPLLILWGADLHFQDMFVLLEKLWRSSALCFVTFANVLCFNMSSPLFLIFLAVSRLILVISPIATKFKETKFVLRSVAALFSVCGFVTICMTIATWALTDNALTWFCSPFVDFTNSVLILQILTWFISLLQLASTVCIIVFYIAMVKFLKQSQKAIQQSVSQTQSHTSLFVQLIIVSISNIICWLSCDVIYIVVMFLENYSTEMFMWVTVALTPINSIVNPSVFIFTTIRKIRNS